MESRRCQAPGHSAWQLRRLTSQRGGHRAIVLFAQDLTQAQRARLRCWRNPRTDHYEVPTESCFYRVLSTVPIPQLGQGHRGRSRIVQYCTILAI